MSSSHLTVVPPVEAPARPTVRTQSLVENAALAATTAAVLLSVVFLAAVHVADRYFVNHVSGHWMTLARYVHDGTIYPPLHDGQNTFGTFYMPLPFVAHGVVSLVTGEYLVSGKLTAYATAVALFALMFVILRRLGCSVLVSAALVAAVIVTPAGLLATMSVRGDALSVVFQLAALLVVIRSASRRASVGAAALCALALASKTTAVWAPAAIFFWLAVRERRQALLFAGYVAGATAAIVGFFELLSGGRLSENILAFAFSQPKDPGSTPLSGASTLVHLAFLDRDAIWLLFPFALLAGVLCLRRRSLTLVQIALAVDLAVLAVVLRDVGADYNHLIDLCVLTALVVGELWARASDLPARWSRLLTAALTAALVLGVVSAFADTIKPDLGPAWRIARGQDPGVDYSTHPLRGVVKPGAAILSEDPALPILSGQIPVTDPLMLSRMEKSHPEWIQQLKDRIDDRSFDDVVLIRPLDPSSYHSVVSFGQTITNAIAANYRPKAVVPTGSLTYYVYVPRHRSGGSSEARPADSSE
jgi:hypothetical protein